MNKEELIKDTIINIHYSNEVTAESLLNIIEYHLEELGQDFKIIKDKILSIRFNISAIRSLFEISREYFEHKYMLKRIINKSNQIIKVYF